MSIPVPLDALATEVTRFGAAYLLTTSGERVKVVSVATTCVDGTLRVGAPGRGSLANVAANPTVTVLYPPLEPGMSLLVDGTAAVDGDDVVVTPTGAVLHKPA